MMAAPTPPKAAAQLVRVESIATVARTTTTAAHLPLVPVPVTGSYAVKSKRQENQVVNVGAPAPAPAPAAKVKPCTEPGRKLAPKKHGVKKLAKKGSLAALTAATAPTRHHPQGVRLRFPKVIFQLLARRSTAIDCALRIVIRRANETIRPMSFVSMLNDASVELENAPLADDYEENIDDYENGELGQKCLQPMDQLHRASEECPS
jgi:hypothetical protein